MMSNQILVTAVLMAGGSSERFEGNKLLADWQGKPLVCSLLGHFPHHAFDRTLVVTRHPKVAQLADEYGCESLLRPQECQDVSGTIRAGLSQLTNSQGCLFAVCDQPLLSPQSVLRLLKTFRNDPQRIVSLSYGGKRGNPVIFPQDLYQELLTLPPGGSGGRVIEAHRHRLTLVEADSAQELLDIDTQDDLNRLSIQAGQRI